MDPTQKRIYVMELVLKHVQWLNACPNESARERVKEINSLFLTGAETLVLHELLTYPNFIEMAKKAAERERQLERELDDQQ